MADIKLQGDISEPALRFVEHWQSIRGDGNIPTSTDFLDNVEPSTQPFVSLNDVTTKSHNRVILFGTGLVDLWKVDLTGKEVQEFIDEDQANRLTTDMLKCAETPCGIWEVSTLRTTTGRTIGWEMVTLPLDLGEPDRYRIARYHHILEPTKKDELIQDILHFQQKEWIDVGAGLPADAPLMKVS